MGQVRVELVGERIWLKAEFDDTAGGKLPKKIPGHSWRGTEKVWTFPLNMQSCRQLRQVFGEKLAIGPNLSQWARAEIEHEKNMGELGAQMDADLEAVPSISPFMADAMESRTYQRSGARFIATGERVLIADEPSLGKTATALGGIMEAGAWKGSHLVVAPKTSLHSTWARQIKLWTGAEAYAMPDGKAARRKRLDEFLASEAPTKFLVVNPEMVRISYWTWCNDCGCEIDREKRSKNPPEHYQEKHKERTEVKKCDWPEILGHEWSSAIVDEVHALLSQYRPNNQTQTSNGLMKIQPHIRIALTGTPLRGHERKLWGTLSWLGVVKGGFWGWIQTWLQVDKSGYGWTIGSLLPHKEQEFYGYLDTYVRRLTKKEARPDLPDKEELTIWVPLSGKHRKQYKEFLEQGEAQLGDATVSSLGPLSEMTRLKQFSFGSWTREDQASAPQPTGESPKIDWLVQALSERGITGDPETDFLPESGLGYKYVVASQFTQVVEATEKVLNEKGIKTLTLTGSVTGRKRNEVVELFNSDDEEFRVLLINTKAGGVSIDLDAWCDEMFIFDETWVSDDQVQLKGRIDNRTGRVAARTFWYILTEGTVEEQIAQMNLSQDEMQKQLLDRRRGVELASRIIEKSKESLTKT